MIMMKKVSSISKLTMRRSITNYPLEALLRLLRAGASSPTNLLHVLHLVLLIKQSKSILLYNLGNLVGNHANERR